MGVEENFRAENTMKTMRTHLRKTHKNSTCSQQSPDTKTLSEEDLKILKDTTEMEENEIVEKHDSFLEKHPDGNISKKSFDQLLSECLTKSSRKKLRSHLWRIYDLNMDGVVDFKEFMVVLKVMSEGSADENLRQIFRFFDVNLNGYIDKLELDRVVRDLQALDKSNQNSSLIAEKAWEEMSPAGGQVSVEQFTAACLANRENTARIIMKVVSLFLDN